MIPTLLVHVRQFLRLPVAGRVHPRRALAAASLTCALTCAVIVTPTLLWVGCKNAGKPAKPAKPAKSAKSAAPVTQRRLRVVTYNVLADPVFKSLRTPAILELLYRADADLLALQEVAPWFLEPLLGHKGIRGRYHVTQRNGRPFAPGGQLILSKRPIAKVSWSVLPGRQRRTLLLVDLRINGRLFRVVTSHLESYLEDGPTRARQLEDTFGRLKTADDALFLGDMNFGDGEQPETSRLDRRFVDLWSSLRKGQPGYTWNIPRNPLARVGSFQNERSRRLDRILLRSPRWRPAAIRLLGNRPVGKGRWFGRPFYRTGNPDIDEAHQNGLEMEVFPSDHYGLVGELVWK